MVRCQGYMGHVPELVIEIAINLCTRWTERAVRYHAENIPFGQHATSTVLD